LGTVAEASCAASGPKAKVKGTIVSRDGDLVKVRDKRDASVHIVKITDKTRIEREKGMLGFFGRTDTDVTALLPGLIVQVEGAENIKGTLDAKIVKFKPNAFAIAVALEKQILNNQAAAGQAQATANQAITSAAVAQSSADLAQSTANQGISIAQAALNQRMPSLGHYVTVDKLEVYFPENSPSLDASAKAALDRLVSANSEIEGYMIEIAGYASSTGPPQCNHRLTEERAAAVAEYLHEGDNVPLLRIAATTGYGAASPVASNADTRRRALNRRVEVRVLISSDYR